MVVDLWGKDATESAPAFLASWITITIRPNLSFVTLDPTLANTPMLVPTVARMVLRRWKVSQRARPS